MDDMVNAFPHQLLVFQNDAVLYPGQAAAEYLHQLPIGMSAARLLATSDSADFVSASAWAARGEMANQARVAKAKGRVFMTAPLCLR